MNRKMEKIKELLRWELRKNNRMYEWNLHLIIVKKYADRLAEIYNADKEIVELSVWLHDIGKIRYGEINHHISGAQDAEVILRDHNYPQDVIDKVKECILTHRCEAKDKQPEGIEAKILATANAMSKMDVIPVFFWEACHEMGLGIRESCDWVAEEIERNWSRKIILPEGKDMVRDKYDAFKVIVETTRESLNGEKNVRLQVT
ncbi:MAG: HD domain-containing protein [Candidatus Aenigmarchaeota archaeon]|nr:HD domain-containing protein [Candidatus Aenigmarchaeota archaeon]